MTSSERPEMKAGFEKCLLRPGVERQEIIVKLLWKMGILRIFTAWVILCIFKSIIISRISLVSLFLKKTVCP